MSSKRLCPNCFGSGKQIGGGMMKEPCSLCEDGYVYPEKSDKPESKLQNNKKIDKRDKSYKDAIQKLKDLGMTEEEAHKEFEKVEK